MNQADILLVGSQEWESFGWTVIEAMVRKTAVVSTNVGGLKEVIGKNGIAGFSIDPADEKSFCEAICSLIKDQTLYKSIVQNGYLRATEMFNVEKMVYEYANIIRGEENNF